MRSGPRLHREQGREPERPKTRLWNWALSRPLPQSRSKEFHGSDDGPIFAALTQYRSPREFHRAAINMKSVLSKIDFAIRIAAAVVVATLGTAMLLLAVVMATDEGTTWALVGSVVIFVIGCCVLAVFVFLAVTPERAEKFIPGPPVLGKILVRIPTYPCGTVGLYLLLSQIWHVAIPDLVG